MPKLSIAEYRDIFNVRDPGRAIFYGGQAPMEPAVAKQALSAWPEVSDPFTPDTILVRIHTDTDCVLNFSVAGDAAGPDDTPMIAGQTEYFAVPKGAGLKVAVSA